MGDNFKNIRVYWLAFIAFCGVFVMGYNDGIGGGIVTSRYFLISFDLKTLKEQEAVASQIISTLHAGAAVGSLTSAPISSRIGRKWTLLVFNIFLLVGTILQACSKPSIGLTTIYAGRALSGFGTGGISAVAPAMVAECAPKEVRGRITGLFDVMSTCGQLFSYLVNFTIGSHIETGVNIWRIPFALPLAPTGVMSIGLFTVKESPRWLASTGHSDTAIKNLAYLRRSSPSDPIVMDEMAEIEVALNELRKSRQGNWFKYAIFGKGNLMRYLIAFALYFFQEWSGQDSINTYISTFFLLMGFRTTRIFLLAIVVYGILKLVATKIFVFTGMETLGRKKLLFTSATGMGALLFIIGALFETQAFSLGDLSTTKSVQPISKVMAAMFYLYICFYSMGWGPVPAVYVSEIFPTATRPYGLAIVSASRWLWSFVMKKITPAIYSALGYNMFFLFGGINIGAMAVFSLVIPETKCKSLEEMDLIFGSTSAVQRQADIQAQKQKLKRVTSAAITSPDE